MRLAARSQDRGARVGSGCSWGVYCLGFETGTRVCLSWYRQCQDRAAGCRYPAVMAVAEITPSLAADEIRRGELAAFLRSRRERITPESVGLISAPRRRTPGLRREEVAQLA